jgi:predicted RNA-binding protein with TRAM domain
VLALLVGPGGTRLEALEAVTRRRFFLTPAQLNGHVHLDHLEMVRQGKLEALRPEAPVEEGATVEVKLVEVGLHDPTAAVGKVGSDYEVVVAGASKLVGKKVKSTVGRALDGVAFATLVDEGAAIVSPITFEAEAEKPTRASRSKKEAEAAPTDSAEVVDVPEEEPETPTTAETAVDGQPKKKRTRRGTRGGRGRKKPAAATATAEDESTSDGRQGPKIHVPPPDLEVAPEDVDVELEPGEEVPVPAEAAADGQPKRKRSRRGSRGGKKRRKPAAANEESVAATEPEPSDEAAPEYVPMSEWIEDFDTARRRRA